METAKVDIRKLQLLNDRINQTIEALNQVRLSVHGISHSSGNAQGIPAHGYPNAFGYGAMGYGNVGYGAPAFGPQGFAGGFGGHGFGNAGYGPGAHGFSHSTGFVPVTLGYMPSVANQNPFFAQTFATGTNPFFGGLSHTSPEATLDPSFAARQAWGQSWGQQAAVDPFYAARISQSFPFAQWPTLPVQGF